MYIYEKVPPPSRRCDGKRDTTTDEIGIRGTGAWCVEELGEKLMGHGDFILGWFGNRIDHGRHLGLVEQMPRGQRDTLGFCCRISAGSDVTDGDIAPAQELHLATGGIEPLTHPNADVVTSTRPIREEPVVPTASGSTMVDARRHTNARLAPTRGGREPRELV